MTKQKKKRSETRIGLSPDKGVYYDHSTFNDEIKDNKTNDNTKGSLVGLESQRETRRLHYDNLLWKITTIYISILGVMLALTYSKNLLCDSCKPSLLIMLFGFIFTIFTFYFAVSFREYRHNLGKPKCEDGLPVIILKQGTLFILLFIIMELLWVYPLINYYPSYNTLWIILICVGLVITLFLDVIVKIKDSLRNYCDGQIEKLNKKLDGLPKQLEKHINKK